MTGNFCADINGNGGGARENRDGEHAVAPCFGYMCDTGEQELIEEELPVLRLVAQHLTKDRVGFGKYRGGLGYEQLITSRDAGFWGFMTGGTGSLHPSAYGLFGGYASPVYTLCKIREVNVFETLKTDPHQFKFDLVELMNEQAIPGAKYGTYDMGMTFEPVDEGEVYMICQGAGAGYGDVLERDPELVIRDLEEDLISHDTARELYHVVYDPASLVLDRAGTEAARAAEREARKRRGKPFDEFVAEWVRDTPPEDLPYYGCWDDPTVIYAGQGAGRRIMRRGAVEGIMMPDPKDVRIAQLEAQLAAAAAGKA